MKKVLLLDFSLLNHMGEILRETREVSSSLGIQLRHECLEATQLSSTNDVNSIIQDYNPTLILLALPQPLLEEKVTLAQFLSRKKTNSPVVIVSESNGQEASADWLNQGVIDFIAASKLPETLASMSRMGQGAQHKGSIVQSLKEKIGLQQLVGESPAFLAELKKLITLAKCDISVLILGETGTGKELFARAIHYLSSRASRTFIPIECGAIPLDLMENELFGHERGAYTGASGQQPGLIIEADGGTLFLDEVDSFPLSAQVKLLRFLQYRQYRPLGSPKVLEADVRIIAATNANLEATVEAGRFRQDLYYRLNGVTLTIAPLRERRSDIPLLVNHFLSKYKSKFNKPDIGFSPESLQKLLLYDWPGNVRELEHAVESAVVFCEGDTIKEEHIIISGMDKNILQQPFHEVKARMISQFEKSYIQGLLVAHQGNVTKASRAAQKDRRAFCRLIRKYDIDVQKFRENNQAKANNV